MRSLCLIVLLLGGALVAQEPQQLHPRTQESFDKVMERYAKTNDRDMVIKNLEELARREWVIRKEYDIALIRSRLAAFHWEAEHSAESLEHARFVLASEAAPDSLKKIMRPLVAQLLINDENFTEASLALADWIARDRPKEAQPYFLAGYCHYQLKEWSQAATMTRLAIDRATTFNLSWYELLAYCLVESGERDQAIEVLEAVLEKKPTEERLWNNLSNQYTIQESFRNALATMELGTNYQEAQAGEWLHMIRLYAFLGNPDRAARILQDKLAADQVAERPDALSLLADCQLLARNREDARKSLVRLAEISPDGRGHERLAELLFQDADYQRAADAYRTALERGGLKDNAKAELYLGISMWQKYKGDYPRGVEGPELEEIIAQLEKARLDEETGERVDFWVERITKYTSKTEEAATTG